MFVLRRGKSYGKTPSFTCSPGHLRELGRGAARGSTCTGSGAGWSGFTNQHTEYASTSSKHAAGRDRRTTKQYDRPANADHYQGCRPDDGTAGTDEPRHAADYYCTRNSGQHAAGNTARDAAGNNTTGHAAGDARKSAGARTRDWMCPIGGNREWGTWESGRIDSGNARIQRAYRLDADNAWQHSARHNSARDDKRAKWERSDPDCTVPDGNHESSG